MARPKQDPVQRFWRSVSKTEDCWFWTGWKDKDGYGALKVDGKMTRAHRYSWQIANGVIPSRMLVCHKCDNPSCVNPDHLFLGTFARIN